MLSLSFTRRPSAAAGLFIILGVLGGRSSAQTVPTTTAPTTPAATEKPAVPDSAITNPGVPTRTAPVQDNRIFGVLPNYRTADGTLQFVPMTAEQKFRIGLKDSFDWPGFFVAAAFSGLYQAENQNPSFGQGIKGYAHRYATSYADQVIGNMMTESIMPSIFREDPRYFRKVHGTVKGRTLYALSRVLVTRTDAGGTRFNFSEVLGNGVAAAIGNAYYPDNRGFGDTMQRMGTSIGTDAISDVLKEFWPDIKRHLFPKRAAANGY